MNEPSLSDLLEVAVNAAKAAGNHALNNKERRKETSEAFDHDVKLVLDIESQKKAEEVIIDAFPPGFIFALFAGFMVLQLAFTHFLMPETKGVSLENIEENV